MKTLRFSSHLRRSKSLAHGANGNCLTQNFDLGEGQVGSFQETSIGHLHDDIIYYYDQNPSGFSFLVPIAAFVI